MSVPDKLIQIILYVSDQTRSAMFYSKLLRCRPVLDVPGMTEFHLNERCKLGLMPEKGIAKLLGDKVQHPETGNGIPRCELYLQVESADHETEHAVHCGAKLITSAVLRDWGHKVGYVSDPDGHIIAFAEISG